MGVEFGSSVWVWFSDVTGITAVAGQTNEVVTDLKRGVAVHGQVDGTVPRPIDNGRVVAHVWPLGWEPRDSPPQWHGLDLCVASGYEGRRCLELFEILEQRALYIGDLDMVYGPDVESDDELDENAKWTTKAQIWAWQKKRGYLPIRDRRQMLRKHLEAKHRDGLSGDVQPTAAPNGGPATVPGESGVTEGPPSVA